MKNKVKILLWGIYSPWTMNFIENFLLKSHYDVWIVNRGNKGEYKKYFDFYKEKGVHLIDVPQEVSVVFDGKEAGNYFKIWYSHFLTIKATLNAGPFDVINMQYVEYSDLIDITILKYLMRAKLVLSYWGSDLFRAEETKIVSMGKFVRQADFITFDNKDLEIEFKRFYRWSDRISSSTVMFGLPVLDIIKKKNTDETKENIRKKWRIPEEKVVIAIGYNGMSEQQHKKVLGVIKKMDNKYKEKIILLLQLSYGGTKSYRNSVVALAKKTGCEYIDIQYFLSNEEIAELRILTDIFINAQITDAFSGSVCENLFADTLLINAKWLRYKELEKYDLKYWEFENFCKINDFIKKSFEKRPDISENKELVWRLRSWECCAPRWEKVYRRVCR